MRKFCILVLMIFLAPSLTLPSASAAGPSAGALCSEIGSIKGLTGHKFTCVKSGKKLVWAKSASNQNSSNNSSSKPDSSAISGSACNSTGEMKVVAGKRYLCQNPNHRDNFTWDNGTPTSFKAPMPITLPVVQSGAITFANALNHISEIPNTSWQRIQDIIDKTPTAKVAHQLLVGPHTTTVTKTVEETILSREFKLWSGFQQTKYLTVIAYNFADMDWAATTYNKVVKARSYPGGDDTQAGSNRAKQSCDIPSGNCDAGNAGQYGGTDEAIEFIGVTTADPAHPWDPTQNGEVGHEYTHTVTSAQFIGTASKNQNDYLHTFMPCWINEGLSQASGIGASTTSFQEYQGSRDGQVTNIHLGVTPKDFKGFTAAGLKDFLYSQIPNESLANSCYAGKGPTYQLGYSIGFAATEALFAIGGPHSVMALVARGAMGDSFSEAFQNVYGISWDEGSTILGQILAAEYAAKPMRS
jgi:hypothetical protein